MTKKQCNLQLAALVLLFFCACRNDAITKKIEATKEPKIEKNFETNSKKTNAIPLAEEEPVFEDLVDVLPIISAPLPLPPPLSPLDLYTGLGGGGGGRVIPPCENHTKFCVDDNPCTLGECIDDQCVFSLDESKVSYGSCEIDGHSCTVGKCVNIDENTFCQEQKLVFLSEMGCKDDNVCTANSCIEIPLKEGSTLGSTANKDKDGNVLLDNFYQCSFESMENMPCFLEDKCLLGMCMVSVASMPGDEVNISCVASASEIPQVSCPDMDNNVCTLETCVIGDGCISTPVAPDTACNDFDPCTLNDACQTDPMTDDFYCFGTPKVLLPTSSGGCSDDDPCTIETCSGGVCGEPQTRQCFDIDFNPCTVEVCNIANGLCEVDRSLDLSGSCNDIDPCTLNDQCRPDPNDNSMNPIPICFGTPAEKIPVVEGGIDDDNPCTMDMCSEGGGINEPLDGPLGSVCQTNYLGICSVGNLQCIDGEEIIDMCVPQFRPGDKEEICGNQLDDDCDGELEENCLRAFVTSTSYNGNLILAANNLPVAVDLVSDYNCSDASYDDGTPNYTDDGDSGVEAADCLCRERAASQGDNLRCADSTFSCWKAWIGDSTLESTPLQRFNIAQQNSSLSIYEVSITGKPLVSAPLATGGFVDLVVCGEAPDEPDVFGGSICLDDPSLQSFVSQLCAGNGRSIIFEDGSFISQPPCSDKIWTNLLSSGNIWVIGQDCGFWNSANPSSPIGRTGQIGAPDESWSEADLAVGFSTCNLSNRLACFEDIPAVTSLRREP